MKYLSILFFVLISINASAFGRCDHPTAGELTLSQYVASDTAIDFDNAYALIIGVGGEGLEVSTRDAQAIHDYLVDPNGGQYLPNHVFLLTGEEATKQGVEEALRKLSVISHKNNRGQQAEGISIILYYSGHGGKLVRNGKDKYFLQLHGSSINTADATMLSGQEFAKSIKDLKVLRLIVLLDCCHSGGMNNSSSFFPSGRALLNELKQPLKRLRLDRGRGRLFIASSLDTEKSWAPPDSLSNSIFTKVLLEALTGVNSDSKPYVHPLDIASHILSQVPVETQNETITQTPILSELSGLDPYYYVCPNQFSENINERNASAKRANKLEFKEKRKTLEKNYKLSKESRKKIKKWNNRVIRIMKRRTRKDEKVQRLKKRIKQEMRG